MTCCLLGVGENYSEHCEPYISNTRSMSMKFVDRAIVSVWLFVECKASEKYSYYSRTLRRCVNLIEVLAYVTYSATKDVWCLMTELKSSLNLDGQLC